MKTDNEIIAEFMGLEKREGAWGGWGSFLRNGDLFCTEWPICYDESWNDLHPVVERIAKWGVRYDENSLRSNRAKEVTNLPLSIDIKLAYFDVVEFIKWYNAQPKQ
jgi:hypothetical protein